MPLKFNPVDRRVELSPGCDLWMMGARMGTVRKVEGEILFIRMDHPQVKKLVKVTKDYVTFRCPRCLGPCLDSANPTCEKGCK